MTTFQFIVMIVIAIVMVPILFPAFFQMARTNTGRTIDQQSPASWARDTFERLTGDDDEFAKVRDAFALIESYLPESDRPAMQTIRDKVAISLFSKGRGR